jgi:hypothetical protein
MTNVKFLNRFIEVGDITVHLALRESPPGMQDTNFVPVTIPPQSITDLCTKI